MGMKVLIVIAALAILYLPSAARGQTIDCGATIVADITLDRDLSCKGNGLVVAKDGVTIDLGGHTMTGPGRGRWIWPGRATSSVGVRVTGRKGVTIRNGHLTKFATGVLLERSRNSTVDGVSTTYSHYGIYLYRSTGNTLSQVTVSHNVYGLHIHQSQENKIVRSDISRQGYSPGGYGINLYRASKNVVTGNNIERNENWGIWIINARDNLIYKNNLINNNPNAIDESGANLWYEPNLKQGNFWSDYRGKGYHSIGGFGAARDLYPFTEKDGWKDEGS